MNNRSGCHETPHRSGRGRKMDSGYQSKFQQNMKLQYLSKHRKHERKKSAGGPSIRNYKITLLLLVWTLHTLKQKHIYNLFLAPLMKEVIFLRVYNKIKR